MTHLHVGIWSDNDATFAQVMYYWGLMDSDGNYHPEMQVSGPITIGAIPGQFYNIRCFGALKDLLETSPTTGNKYAQTLADGTLRSLFNRTRLVTLATRDGAVVSDQIIPDDGRRPPRIDMGSFQVFDLADVKTPANVWA